MSISKELENFILSYKKNVKNSSGPNILTAYKLRVINGLTNKEISKEMNISYGWVRSLLYRAESLVEKFPKYQKSQKSIQLILKKYPLKFRKKKAA